MESKLEAGICASRAWEARRAALGVVAQYWSGNCKPAGDLFGNCCSGLVLPSFVVIPRTVFGSTYASMRSRLIVGRRHMESASNTENTASHTARLGMAFFLLRIGGIPPAAIARCPQASSRPFGMSRWAQCGQASSAIIAAIEEVRRKQPTAHGIVSRYDFQRAVGTAGANGGTASRRAKNLVGPSQLIGGGCTVKGGGCGHAVRQIPPGSSIIFGDRRSCTCRIAGGGGRSIPSSKLIALPRSEGVRRTLASLRELARNRFDSPEALALRCWLQAIKGRSVYATIGAWFDGSKSLNQPSLAFDRCPV